MLVCLSLKDFPAFFILEIRKPVLKTPAKSVEGKIQMESQNKGNKLVELFPTKFSHLFKVKLNLDFQTRYIGTLDISGQGTFFTERKEKHIFRRTNSVGLNGELLNSSDIQFKYITIDYNGQKLSTTRMYFLTHSKCFTFKNFERQYFLPLNEFGLNKANEYEHSLNEQLTLFGEVA